MVRDRQANGKAVVAEFETDAGFFFHTANAFGEKEETDGPVAT
jgi:torulene dioxygenase